MVQKSFRVQGKSTNGESALFTPERLGIIPSHYYIYPVLTPDQPNLFPARSSLLIKVEKITLLNTGFTILSGAMQAESRRCTDPDLPASQLPS